MRKKEKWNLFYYSEKSNIQIKRQFKHSLLENLNKLYIQYFLPNVYILKTLLFTAIMFSS